jgi:hypothetical protein
LPIELIKNHPVMTALGIFIAMLSGIQTLWSASAQTANFFGSEITYCLFPSDKYEHESGFFAERDRSTWIEYDGINVYHFDEMRRDWNHIYLRDDNRAKDPSRPMVVRLPKCGGAAEWTYPNPAQWTPFREVVPVRG